ncbi:DNA replication/checkpoint protein [Hypoxylon trugodes]|uniref:DNA replication/checkpoint protein n=1 Tax=Hypoxylon trugodes TaxID=326681 RepID=UPI00219A5DA4|nr:DNA replication/checkpoint protein [Hypoxylon trugodes]KAI1385357.1 DNA replication/checkpoint protein [Hypoxylon trugodes]
MDAEERQQYEETSKQLRAELKRFESDWARHNDGRKPRRENIKENPEIAGKYKEYNRIRDILAGKLPPKSKDSSRDHDRKRQLEEIQVQTPSKRPRQAETPIHLRERIIPPEMFETPSSRKLFSPPMPTSIGPTPHRDGRVLGLFDLLSENDENSPLKSRHTESTKDSNIQATPSKRSTEEVGDGEDVKLGRTPTSTTKRGNLFMTPSKRRDGNAALGRTPTSASKSHLSTPSFLRRAPLATVDENGDYISPAPLRLPRKPLGRSLSSVVASLRKLEEEALDDDLEALHEMEDESNPSKPAGPVKPKEDILEPDSQAQQLLGGFDDEAFYDSEPQDELGRNGQPLRVYKKKGQKRTTRRANLKPTRSKRPQDATEQQSELDIEGDSVPETQLGVTKGDNVSQLDLLSGSDLELPEEKNQSKKAKKADRTEGKAHKAARKVNELAHANFKRLKLRNNGSKGSGAKGRFRRRG